MYILASNMWFTTLIKQFFFSIDKIVFNFISSIYDVLITIARTSVLTQADIADMADRIYKLLAIFMVFKVTLSLITYVVNPDDFSDKSKGISKLSKNIIISLALLILTPYLFNYAYQFQTIILEDNSLSTLIFGEDSTANGTDSFFNSAGDKMAYTTISAFFSPNLSLEGLIACDTISELQGEKKVFSDECYKAMEALLDPDEVLFTRQSLDNYKIGVEKGNFGMLFRQELAVATDPSNQDYIMDYKFIFSTIVGVVIILLLINFCMDIAVRSIKLAFLQLVAPIPIISYVDPKSGKDGLFKKWYDMCFKTYLSLFVRLLALYFAVYIISNVADMRLVDVIDGSYVTNGIIAIFIIIGALMFAKQLPKILEGLGIKLDGGGKFTLNPIKKFNEEALGGKRITGALGGMTAGLAGGGRGIGRFTNALTGAARGFSSNKGFSGGLAKQADVNRKLREARINGAGFFGSRAAVLSSKLGLDDYGLEKEATNLRKDKRAIELRRRDVDNLVKQQEVRKKQKQDAIAERKKEIQKHKRMQDAVGKMEERAKAEIQNGNGGSIGQEYLTRKAKAEYYENNIGKSIMIGGVSTTITPEMAGAARKSANSYLNDEGMKAYMSKAATGGFDDGKDDKTFVNYYKTYKDSAVEIGFSVETDGDIIHSQYGSSKGHVGDIERDIAPTEQEISDIDDTIRNIQAKTEVEISGTDKPITLEEAERIIREREQNLKDKQEQNKLNRTLASDRRIGGGSK